MKVMTYYQGTWEEVKALVEEKFNGLNPSDFNNCKKWVAKNNGVIHDNRNEFEFWKVFNASGEYVEPKGGDFVVVVNP